MSSSQKTPLRRSPPVVCLLALCIGGSTILAVEAAAQDGPHSPPQSVPPQRYILNMVHPNPGGPPTQTKWNCPDVLKARGFNGQVAWLFVQCAIPYTSFDPQLLPAGTEARRWIDAQAATIDANLRLAREAGMPQYPFTDVLVVPKSLLQKYGPQMKTGDQLDIAKPMTREVIRRQVAEIFARFPDLAGLTLRLGETYTMDAPHHDGGRPMPFDGEEAIRGHIALLKLLREEVCVKRNKVIFYRTWDFGQFHIRPDFYLKVANAVAPHPNLIFSIKHQAGDFQRLTPFNPTIGIGKHRQIIEVSCQPEGYGKEAHPYYIGQGVIDGWEEYAWMMKPGEPRGLRDVVGLPQFAGVWTWSRGGGWEGPFITNELWCDLNTYVVSQFVIDPKRSEEEIFNQFARHKLGLDDADVKRFRELSLLSAAAALRGQLSLKGSIDPWWARDDHFDAPPDLGQFVAGRLVEKVLAEKAEAVRIWKRIEQLAGQIHFADKATEEYVKVSSAYGRIKYAVIEQAWTILLYGAMGDASKNYNKKQLAAAIAQYDRLWAEWRQLKEDHACCATLYKDTHSPCSTSAGLGESVNRYRKLLTESPKK